MTTFYLLSTPDNIDEILDFVEKYSEPRTLDNVEQEMWETIKEYEKVPDKVDFSNIYMEKLSDYIPNAILSYLSKNSEDIIYETLKIYETELNNTPIDELEEDSALYKLKQLIDNTNLSLSDIAEKINNETSFHNMSFEINFDINAQATSYFLCGQGIYDEDSVKNAIIYGIETRNLPDYDEFIDVINNAIDTVYDNLNHKNTKKQQFKNN